MYFLWRRVNPSRVSHLCSTQFRNLIRYIDIIEDMGARCPPCGRECMLDFSRVPDGGTKLWTTRVVYTYTLAAGRSWVQVATSHTCMLHGWVEERNGMGSLLWKTLSFNYLMTIHHSTMMSHYRSPPIKKIILPIIIAITCWSLSVYKLPLIFTTILRYVVLLAFYTWANLC